MANKRTNRNRWGKVAEIAHVPSVDSPQFKTLPPRLKNLASWRAMHALRTHSAVRQFGRRKGYKPSSDLPIKTKVAFVDDRINRDRRATVKCRATLPRLPH